MKPVATVGSMHVCPLTTGTVPHVGGPISGPGVPTALLDGQPVAVVGDMCTCCGPPDVILQGAATAFIDGKPIALMGSMTAHGGQIVQGIPTATIGPADPPTPRKAIADIQESELLEIEESTYEEAELEPPLFTGCVENPLVEEREEGVEESSNIKLETNILLDELRKYAEGIEENYFIADMQAIYGEDILSEIYLKFYNQLKIGEVKAVPIEVVKNNVAGYAIYDPPLPLNSAAQKPEKQKLLGIFPRKQEEQKKGKNVIFVSESIVRTSQKDKGVHEQLMDRLADEFSNYISYLLQYEIKTEGDPNTHKKEENEVKKYF